MGQVTGRVFGLQILHHLVSIILYSSEATECQAVEHETAHSMG